MSIRELWRELLPDRPVSLGRPPSRCKENRNLHHRENRYKSPSSLAKSTSKTQHSTPHPRPLTLASKQSRFHFPQKTKLKRQREKNVSVAQGKIVFPLWNGRDSFSHHNTEKGNPRASNGTGALLSGIYDLTYHWHPTIEVTKYKAYIGTLSMV